MWVKKEDKEVKRAPHYELAKNCGEKKMGNWHAVIDY